MTLLPSTSLVYLYLLLLSVLASDLITAQAQRNITIDDNNPRIVYSHGWQRIQDTDGVWVKGGAHMLSSFNPNAHASFKFNGTAIYYLAPRWPYRVGARIQIDERESIVDLQDHMQEENTGSGPSVSSEIVWLSQNLDPAIEHTMHIYPDSDADYFVLDTLMYTSLFVEDDQASPAEEEPTQENAKTEGVPMAMGIGIGVGVSILVVLLGAFTLVWLRKRRQRSRDAENKGRRVEFDYSRRAHAVDTVSRPFPSPSWQNPPSPYMIDAIRPGHQHSDSSFSESQATTITISTTATSEIVNSQILQPSNNGQERTVTPPPAAVAQAQASSPIHVYRPRSIKPGAHPTRWKTFSGVSTLFDEPPPAYSGSFSATPSRLRGKTLPVFLVPPGHLPAHGTDPRFAPDDL
ncbi:hypothetical protein FA15DRAFT_705366 [Coprinopsis marcescibilis]|uniref:Uncharacterized protein n=1 Tax=Coprinopsis marcescibilis TaxID=230819 RepID=A0A5C3KUR4_COPMA|nr:hypothetical protein FA15DRAFT_705366 [Coprinopsis marcescibilis]